MTGTDGVKVWQWRRDFMLVLAWEQKTSGETKMEEPDWKCEPLLRLCKKGVPEAPVSAAPSHALAETRGHQGWGRIGLLTSIRPISPAVLWC